MSDENSIESRNGSVAIYSSICYLEDLEAAAIFIVKVDAPPYTQVKYELMNKNQHDIKTTSGREHVVYFECDPVDTYCLKVTIKGEYPQVIMTQYDITVLDHFYKNKETKIPIHIPQVIAKKDMANKRKIALQKFEELKKTKLG